MTVFTTLSFDGEHLIERCVCGAQVSIDSRAGRGIQLIKHDEFVRQHENCGAAEGRVVQEAAAPRGPRA